MDASLTHWPRPASSTTPSTRFPRTRQRPLGPPRKSAPRPGRPSEGGCAWGTSPRQKEKAEKLASKTSMHKSHRYVEHYALTKRSQLYMNINFIHLVIVLTSLLKRHQLFHWATYEYFFFYLFYSFQFFSWYINWMWLLFLFKVFFLTWQNSFDVIFYSVLNR